MWSFRLVNDVDSAIRSLSLRLYHVCLHALCADQTFAAGVKVPSDSRRLLRPGFQVSVASLESLSGYHYDAKLGIA